MKLIFTLLFLCSCSRAVVKFNSYPLKTNVSIVNQDGSVRQLGLTPISLSSDDVFKSSKAVKIIYSKEGFVDESVVLLSSILSSSYDVTASLKEVKMSSSKDALKTEKLEELSFKVAQVQNYIYAKNLQMAEQISIDLIKDYPEISVPYDLLGNTYFLMNKRQKALNYYIKAENISPGSKQREQMIERLRN